MAAGRVRHRQEIIRLIPNRPAKFRSHCKASSHQQRRMPVGSSPQQFAAYMRSEAKKWAEIVKASGARAD